MNHNKEGKKNRPALAVCRGLLSSAGAPKLNAGAQLLARFLEAGRGRNSPARRRKGRGGEEESGEEVNAPRALVHVLSTCFAAHCQPEASRRGADALARWLAQILPPPRRKTAVLQTSTGTEWEDGYQNGPQ